MSAKVVVCNLLSHFWSDDVEASNLSEDLHDDVTVGHSTVDHEPLELGLGVKGHSLDDGTGLEGIRFQYGTGNVRRVGVLGETWSGKVKPKSAVVESERLTNESTSGTGVPVWGQQSGERSDEVQASGVLLLGGEGVHFMGLLDETHRVTKPLDGGARDSD